MPDTKNRQDKVVVGEILLFLTGSVHRIPTTLVHKLSLGVRSN